MKHIKNFVMGCSIALAMTIYPSLWSASNLRIWEIVDLTTSKLDTIESLVELLPSVLFSDSFETFTMLETIILTGSSLNTVLTEMIEEATVVNVDLSSLSSVVDLLDQSINVAQDNWDSITINDFGGTWTLIDHIENTLGNQVQSLQIILSSLGSSIDLFDVQNGIYFAQIFNEITSISSDIFATLTTAQYTEGQIESNFNTIINSYHLFQQLTRTVNSQLDVIDVTLQEDFVDTFTTLNVINNLFFSIGSTINNIEARVSEITVTFTAVELLLLQSETIGSKIDVIGTLMSAIDPLAGLVKSQSDVLSSKIAVVNDEMNTLEAITITIDSIVDVAGRRMRTLTSFIDTANSQNVVFGGLLTIEAQITSLDTTIQVLDSDVDLLIVQNISFESKVDIMDSYIDRIIESNNTIISTVEVLEEVFTSNIEQLNSINSFINVASSSIDYINESAITSKIIRAISVTAVLDSNVASVIRRIQPTYSLIASIYTKDSILDSLIDLVATPTTITILSKLSLLNTLMFTATTIVASSISANDVNSSIIDVNIRNATTLQSQLRGLEYGFQQTWTILQTIQNRSNSALSSVDAVESIINKLIANPTVDLSATYSALAVLNNNTQTLTSSVSLAISIASRLDCVSQADLNGTYTVLDQINALSRIVVNDALAQVDLTNNILENYGIPIGQVDVGTTGTILSISGTYYLSENITFTAASSGLAAITIAVNNVDLKMLRRTVMKGGSQNGVVGVRINQGLSGITLVGGSLLNFSGHGIEASGFNNGIFLTDMNIINACGNGIDFNTSSTAISIQGCIISNACGNGIDIDTCSNIRINNCMLTDNGFSTTNAGLLVNNPQKIVVSYCMSTTNNGDGYALVSTTTSYELELYNNKSYKNSGNGISLRQIQSSVITSCVCSENGNNGINLSDCRYIDLMNNICMNNSTDGIVLGTNSVGTSDCYIAGNSLLLTGSVNIHEKSGSGPNCILSNLALSVSNGNNYASDSGRSYLNFITVSQSGAFPIASPVKWYNISMTA